ncbi:MAG TPA: ABC transporter ATP-binding protein [Gammaproteobacteria bacterium]|nr:ABC transporter ATP-binding protein [Gammaproteobacteria bacterium]
MTRLQTQNLCVEIGGRKVCDNLQLSLNPGEIWGVLGRNGVGKTTLLHTLAGLRTAASGNILLDQQDIAQLPRRSVAQKLGLLLQHIEDAFPVSVLETVVSGRHPHISNWQWENRADYAMAHSALERVEMDSFSQRQVNELSGGERQRVSIATLLTQNPDIFLLDEPSSHLDLKYQIQLLDILSDKARKQQKTILMTLHDLNLAARFCDSVLLLTGDGNTLMGKTEALLTEENLMKMYDYPIIRVKSAGRSVFVAK